MNDALLQLERASRGLNPDATERHEMARLVLAHAESFLEEVPKLKTFYETPAPSDVLSTSFPEEGRGLEACLAAIKNEVDRPGITTTAPRFFGYVPGGGLYHAAFADYLAAVSNKYAGVSFASPGAVRVEDQCLDFLASIVGYDKTQEPTGYGGYLASGGSLANFTAIVTARDAKHIHGPLIAKSTVYLTDHAHHCLDKALHLAGLSGCIVRRIPVDAQFRMRVDVLENQLDEDKKAGLKPFLIVGTAGTTNTGSIDPLEALGHLATAADAWFHVDGAYGALFALCDEGKRRLHGMHLSDSIVLDPHKTLFLPYGIGALLVRDKRLLLEAHAAGADYMQDAIHVQATSPATVSPELTKHFRGLRMWLPLQAIGVSAFRNALAEKMALATYFRKELSQIDGFEVGPEPDLSIVTFRYVPKSGDAEEANARLVQQIHEDGRIFISSTRLDGVFTLRLAIVCFRSHKEDVDVAISVLRELTEA